MATKPSAPPASFSTESWIFLPTENRYERVLRMTPVSTWVWNPTTGRVSDARHTLVPAPSEKLLLPAPLKLRISDAGWSLVGDPTKVEPERLAPGDSVLIYLLFDDLSMNGWYSALVGDCTLAISELVVYYYRFTSTTAQPNQLTLRLPTDVFRRITHPTVSGFRVGMRVCPDRSCAHSQVISIDSRKPAECRLYGGKSCVGPRCNSGPSPKGGYSFHYTVLNESKSDERTETAKTERPSSYAPLTSDDLPRITPDRKFLIVGMVEPKIGRVVNIRRLGTHADGRVLVVDDDSGQTWLVPPERLVGCDYPLIGRVHQTRFSDTVSSHMRPNCIGDRVWLFVKKGARIGATGLVQAVVIRSTPAQEVVYRFHDPVFGPSLLALQLKHAKRLVADLSLGETPPLRIGCRDGSAVVAVSTDGKTVELTDGQKVPADEIHWPDPDDGADGQEVTMSLLV